MSISTAPPPPSQPRTTGRRLFKRFLVGRSHPSHRLENARLPKFLALPIFSSDPLSSVAYATEQILVVLLAASTGSRNYLIPISLAIVFLQVVVVSSYWQTCAAYPGGGGGYVVTKDNFGRVPSLLAASALLVDMVLTVAVSVVAGVVAITSAAPGLLPHLMQLSLGFVVLLTLANLRGVRESGLLFAIPTYAFVIAILAMIVFGLLQCAGGGCPQAESVRALPGLAAGAGSVGLFVVLRAFSSGATALTGVEAIATSVPAFKRPQARNAQLTLLLMGGMAVAMFFGISYLARHTGVVPSHERSVVAQIAHAVFDGGWPFYVIQILTTAILVLAANTAYQAFPRLLAILAEDRFAPRAFLNIGDRLVYSNGVVVLAVLAGLLIYAFDANLDRLIQLYVVGVFTDFTLSQAGMVRLWLRLRREDPEKAKGWQIRLTFNAIGAATTGLVLVIVTATKFTHGAWIVVTAIPLIMLMLGLISRHYSGVRAQLREVDVPPPAEVSNRVVLVVPDTGPATAEALGYVRSIRPTELRAIHISNGSSRGDVESDWTALSRGKPSLDVVGGDGDTFAVIKRYISDLAREESDFVTVVLPEEVKGRGMGHLVRNPGLVRLKSRLLREPGVVVSDVPVHLQGGIPLGVDGRPLIPVRSVALVLVSTLHAATLRAVRYAESLQASETRAIYFALDAKSGGDLVRQWEEHGIQIPLDLIQAPFRDLTEPLLEEVRRYSSREDTVVAAVLPELLVRRWWHAPLHAPTALFIKRALLFEPRVVLSSVPYALK